MNKAAWKLGVCVGEKKEREKKLDLFLLMITTLLHPFCHHLLFIRELLFISSS